MTEGQRKTGEELTAAERETLLRVCALDCSPRGCFARRETLAGMLDCSVSRVEHALADLKRQGLVTVDTRGRRRDEAAVIRVTSAGRKVASGLQAVYRQSRPVSKDEYLAPEVTTGSKQTPVPAAAEPEPEAEAALQVVESPPAPVQLVSSQGVWLRVKDAEGSIIFERIMDAGTPYEVPLNDPPAVIERAGNASALFFLVDGALYGPAGGSGRVAKNIELSAQNLTQTFERHAPQDQSPLYSFLLELETDRVNP